MWPQRINGTALLHGLTALDFLKVCDEKRLATLFFPWNRNSASSQRQILVDRTFIYRATLPPLNRILPKHSIHPAYGYVIALHSLNTVTGAKKSRLIEALKNDPGLEHPTLFEIMPQQGLQSAGLHTYETHFLDRLQRFTWVRQRHSYMEAATNPQRAPFFLFGLDTDVLSLNAFRELGVDPQHDGRMPDVVLIDLTSRARNRLGRDWQRQIRKFLDLTLELYLDECPPVLAVTDDAFVCETLRHDILREHEKWRSPNITGPVRPVKSQITLTLKSDPLDQEAIVTGSPSSVRAEVYGTDVLRLVERGLQLRRSLLDAGEDEIGEAVGTAVSVIQNTLSIPGQPQQFHEFLAANYDGYQFQRLGTRFDHQAPYSKLVSVLRSGFAGSLHSELSSFLAAFEELRTVVDSDNPGRRLFDECVRNFVNKPVITLLVFPSEVLLAFAEWRIENEPDLQHVREALGDRLLLVERKELNEELDRRAERAEKIDRLVFLEPRPDDFLSLLVRQFLPNNILLLANLARIEQILRRIRILLALDGVAAVKDRLLSVQLELDQALAGHTCDIGDLDSEGLPFNFGTLDFTDTFPAWDGAIRVIQVSDNLRIRAFEGSEFALYDADALQRFSRRFARDLQPGDEICVLSPDFVSLARERLKFSADAPDVLRLYHKAIIEKAEQLPGRDLNAKAASLRGRMTEIDQVPDLPTVDAMRRWIDVAALLDAPRDSVRPQAPGNRRHYLSFMKALNISDDVAHLYWNLGIFFTKSKRIQRGAFFHQTFMAVLIDPYGTASRLDEKSRPDMWQIYDAAADHVATVISNQLEGEK
jgi:hypothetical protein